MQYYTSLLENSKGNFRATWNVINEILNKKRVKSTNVNYLMHNGKRCTDNKRIANIFNNFFKNIGPSLANNLPNANKTFKEWMNVSSPTKLSFEDISPYDVF